MEIKIEKSKSEKLREQNQKKVLQLYKQIIKEQPDISNNKAYKYIADYVGYSVSGVRKIVETYETEDTIEKINKNSLVRKKPHDDEHRLQVACVRWFKYQYPSIAHALFAVPNGGRRDITTGAKLKAEGALAGVSDLILLKSNDKYGALLIEMKTPKGKQSQYQKQWEKDITKHNEYKYIVCHSFEEFQKGVNEYLSTALNVK